MTNNAVRLVVGLGNPGAEYARTRHNAGAWFVDAFARWCGVVLRAETKFCGAIAKFTLRGSISSSSGWLLRPSTYMNESGRSVLAVTRFYKIPLDSILIVHDDLDFEPGVIRLKQGGGHGGHNGLRDIVKHVKTSDFFRLRIGIGHPGSQDRVTPYVLSAPSCVDRERIERSIEDGRIAVPYLLSGEVDRAFRMLHSSVVS